MRSTLASAMVPFSYEEEEEFEPPWPLPPPLPGCKLCFPFCKHLLRSSAKSTPIRAHLDASEAKEQREARSRRKWGRSHWGSLLDAGETKEQRKAREKGLHRIAKGLHRIPLMEVSTSDTPWCGLVACCLQTARLLWSVDGARVVGRWGAFRVVGVLWLRVCGGRFEKAL